MQTNDGYFDLRIDNESFSHVYNKLKMSDHFTYENGVNQMGQQMH